MEKREYMLECRRLSAEFDKKMKAADAYFDTHPDLATAAECNEYWDLQNEALTAGREWSEFCAYERPIHPRSR